MRQNKQPIQPYFKIVNKLIHYIGQQRLVPGHYLPCEGDLITLFNVHPIQLRETLIILEIMQLIEIRKHSGVILRKLIHHPMVFPHLTLEELLPSQLFSIRKLVEPYIALLSARKAKPKDILRLAEYLNLMENALILETETLKKQLFETSERAFYLVLADIANNIFLNSLTQQLWAKNTRGLIWNRMNELASTSYLYTQWVDNHQSILSAVRKRNEHTAKSAILHHLNYLKQHFILHPIEQSTSRTEPSLFMAK